MPPNKPLGEVETYLSPTKALDSTVPAGALSSESKWVSLLQPGDLIGVLHFFCPHLQLLSYRASTKRPAVLLAIPVAPLRRLIMTQGPSSSRLIASLFRDIFSQMSPVVPTLRTCVTICPGPHLTRTRASGFFVGLVPRVATTGWWGIALLQWGEGRVHLLGAFWSPWFSLTRR
jgi:hypothetical protein